MSTWQRRPGAGPRLIHVTAPASRGGEAELLTGLVSAQAAAGLSVGWLEIDGNDAFFAFTRYLNHLLHGWADSVTVDRLAVSIPQYRDALTPQADRLATHLDPGDAVVLHDPQTLGMAPTLAAAGLRVIWHCHNGTTEADASGPAAVWHSLSPELSTLDAVVSTLPEFAPQAVPAAQRHVVAPAVDPNSPRNRSLSKQEMAELLSDPGHADEDQRVPDGAPVVLQTARWEPLKDMLGALRCISALPADVHLVLAGPQPDDAESRAVLESVREQRAGLLPGERARVHLIQLSTSDTERSALTANALQRRADIVLQKSLAEGLGLTVTEAMVKGRAVVAADVGGLRQQVSPGHSGLLVNPRDANAVAEALQCLLEDPLLRRRLGKHAMESVQRRYLMPRMVADYQLFAQLQHVRSASSAQQRAREAA